MPDDAIERARQIMIEELRKAGCRAPLDQTIQPFLQAGVRACLAFASQQAPVGWREALRPFADLANEMERVAAQQLVTPSYIRRMAPYRACAKARAMLDAAPSVTLGEVG